MMTANSMKDLQQKLQSFITLPSAAVNLGLERIERLLAALGDPHLRLPPVIHVAGTNGKGSAVAFMRAMLEAAGLRVHVFTSPHLIRFNERICLAGELADDETLIKTFADIAAVNDGAPITYFEMTTVAAFVLFARVPADVVLLEVGLGGRLDATNVITPAVSMITRISYDHTHLLGNTLEKITTEKAGIMKPGVPCVMAYQADEAVRATLRAHAVEVGCELIAYGKNFWTEELSDGFVYKTEEQTGRSAEEVKYAPPALLGAHQILNAANAITAVKVFSSYLPSPISHLEEAIRTGLRTVEWPGRLQRITTGPVAATLPEGVELWYDGAHNDSGAEVLAEQCRRWKAAGYEIHLIMGMLKTKDPSVFFKISPWVASITAVPIDNTAYTENELVELLQPINRPIQTASDIYEAVRNLTAEHKMIKGSGSARLLVCGSLHLAAGLLAH